MAEVVAETDKKCFAGEFWDIVRLEKTKVASEINQDKSKKGWRSYKFVCDMEGKELTDELLRLKLFETQRYPKLPKDSLLQEPFCNQIWWEQGIVVKISETRQSVSQTSHTDKIDSETASSFDAMFNERHNGRQGGTIPPEKVEEPVVGGANLSPVEEEPVVPLTSDETNVAVKNASEAHRSWDDSHRKFRSVLARSATCKGTQKTPTEKALTSLVKEGITSDKVVTDFLENELSRMPLSSKDLKECKEACEKLWSVTQV